MKSTPEPSPDDGSLQRRRIYTTHPGSILTQSVRRSVCKRGIRASAGNGSRAAPYVVSSSCLSSGRQERGMHTGPAAGRCAPVPKSQHPRTVSCSCLRHPNVSESENSARRILEVGCPRKSPSAICSDNAEMFGKWTASRKDVTTLLGQSSKMKVTNRTVSSLVRSSGGAERNGGVPLIDSENSSRTAQDERNEASALMSKYLAS